MTDTPQLRRAGLFRVLYLFAGARRKSDLEECFSKLSESTGFTMQCKCVDLIRGKDDDILLPGLWDSILEQIKSSFYQADVIFLSYPWQSSNRC